MRRSFLMLLGFLFLQSCSDKSEKTKPAIGTMTESVYASVTIQPEDIYDVYTAAPGILENIFVNEGDTVAEGQILAQITASDPKINIENATLSLELARENYKGKATILSSIADEITSNEKQLILDSLNYFRQKSLWEQNIGSKYELENKKLKYELTFNNLDVLRKKYQQTRLELENSYKQSQVALKKAESNFSDYFIKAKINGKIYSLLKNEGELINLQEPLAQIGKSNSFLLEMLIDEVDIAKVELGQLALITLDAYPGEVFEAVITKIYLLKDNRTQTFKVEGKFRQPPKMLYAGLSGEANIILTEKKNTLTIPLEYLIDENKVKTADGEIKVQVGMKNIERAEIISGIDTATVIIKP